MLLLFVCRPTYIKIEKLTVVLDTYVNPSFLLLFMIIIFFNNLVLYAL